MLYSGGVVGLSPALGRVEAERAQPSLLDGGCSVQLICS